MREEGLARRNGVREASFNQWRRLCALALRETGTWLDPADARAAIGDAKLGLLATPREFAEQAHRHPDGETVAYHLRALRAPAGRGPGTRLRRPRSRRRPRAPRGRRASPALAEPLQSGARRRVSGHRAGTGTAGPDPGGAAGRLLLRGRRGPDPVRMAPGQRAPDPRPRPRLSGARADRAGTQLPLPARRRRSVPAADRAQRRPLPQAIHAESAPTRRAGAATARARDPAARCRRDRRGAGGRHAR